jgi:enamine deaminase RidA (YjgF/YER057c/UK114 family)
MDYDARVKELGIELPDFNEIPYFGLSYGSMRSHRIVGNMLYLSGHVPELPDRTLLHPGRLGDTVTLEQGYEAARLTGINALAGIKYAVGSLNNVVNIVKSLMFVVCTPDFYDVHKVSSGCSDVWRDVFGEEHGLGGRATIGVQSLARNNSFETWLDVEVKV